MAPSWAWWLVACGFLMPMVTSAMECADVCRPCSNYQLSCLQKGFSVRLSKGNLDIRCSKTSSHVPDFKSLRDVTDLPRFRFRQLTYAFCPMPEGNVSLAEQLSPLLGPNALTELEELYFVDNRNNMTNTSLEPALFEGLTSLTILSLKNAANQPLSNPALFSALPQLTWLDLREGTGRDPLQPTILRPLPALRNLELTQNNLVALPAGLVEGMPHLEMVNLFNNLLERLDRFVGLPRLHKMDLITNRLTVLEENVFEELPQLRELMLKHNLLTSLPGGLFKNNALLTKFDASNQGGPGLTVGDGLFANLSTLVDVSLAKCNISDLPVHLFVGATSLANVDLSNNQLQTLPDALLVDGTKLKTLNLSHNKLHILNRTLLESTSSLKELYLQHNQLSLIDLHAFSSLSKSLTILNLSHNQLVLQSIYDEGVISDGYQTPFASLHNLVMLDLSHNRITDLFYDFTIFMPNLKHVNLSHNEIMSISDSGFPFQSKAIHMLDLRWNRIEQVSFANVTRLNDVLPREVLLDENPLQCDCNLYGLVKHAQTTQPAAFSLKLSKLRCVSPPALVGSPLHELNLASLLCDVTPETNFCPSACSCQLRPATQGVVVNCTGQHLRTVPAFPSPATLRYQFVELHLEHNELHALPVAGNRTGWDAVRWLYLSNNNLTTLAPESLPTELEELDVSSNRLATASSQLVDALKNRTTLQSIHLAANPLVCECGEPLITFVHEYTRHVADSHALRCADGRPIDSSTVSELCRTRTQLIIALCLLLAILTSVVLALFGLYTRYEHEVKVWLFRNNLLQWLVAEEQLDQDKRYDAFVSYSHQDEAFIAEELVPTLEREPMNFKLCWHVRDFMPGEMISTQITKAVEDSRRTIIVLSKHYLESMWGQMEFQTAYDQSVTDKRNRVILIVYDDIGNIDQLDPQMRGYINTNTYLRRDDRWFWEKLQYAMPHPRRIRGTRASIDKLNLLQPPALTGSPSAPDSTPPIERDHGKGKSLEAPLASYCDVDKIIPFTISDGKLDAGV
uniref:TIR domain-containing protein n=1 Tax=Anopheles farauti TaxID=69004 RepID=A0A182QDR2_9DIPT